MCVCVVSLYHSSVGVFDVAVADGFVDEEAVIGSPEVTDGDAVAENGLQSKHGYFPVREGVHF